MYVGRELEISGQACVRVVLLMLYWYICHVYQLRSAVGCMLGENWRLVVKLVCCMWFKMTGCQQLPMYGPLSSAL